MWRFFVDHPQAQPCCSYPMLFSTMHRLSLILRRMRPGTHYVPSLSITRSICHKRHSSSLTDATRMKGYPDKLFLIPAHTQLPVANPSVPNTQSLEKNRRKGTSMRRMKDGATFRAVLRKFSEHIRMVHKRQITWPKEDLFEHSEYVRSTL